MINLDGKNISEFGFEVEPGHEDPITPNMERKTLPIPGRPGLWDFGTEIRERPFSFPVKIMDRFHDNMQQAYNELVAFLFDQYGRPREIKMVREYEPDKFYMVKVAQQMIPERPSEDGTLNLPFVADDPYKYSNTFADEVTWGSEIITFEYHYLLGREGLNGSVKITTLQTLNIPVDGLAIQPIFEISGTASNLTISANSHSFTLPNFNNETWEADFEKYVVFRNGKDTMIEIRDFYLMPGNNQVKITGSNININMRIKFRDKYS
ncbi:phage tail family protein [Lederbergia sp. NSJ-179]|uniref:distal tail protein Dit n=1 Tax=Lederbergia sp. NSJ-179 TaxID=2931402 RepID=UPI001FCFC8BC|nr:distal tail protein Dit [Lederbergia sp. NSJ-179]MCJ7840502.1 phage tail family protein [Lederbergia sp. NSJ-179]